MASSASMLTLDDLISAARQSVTSSANLTAIEGGSFINDTAADKYLGKIAQLASSFQPIKKPLPKCTSEKIQRIAAYKQITKDISKWMPAISTNRQADSLSIPVRNNGDISTNSSVGITSRFVPESNLEKQMAFILNTDSTSPTFFNENIDPSLSGSNHYEAIKARQIELQKLRSFLFFQQQKNKRTSKIKSKAYHRILKKVRQSKNAKLLESEPADSKSLLRAEIARARERMTQKHQRRHSSQHLDSSSPEAQLANEDQLRIQKLKSKMYLSNEEEEDVQQESLEDQDNPPKSSLFSLKFMKRRNSSIDHPSDPEISDSDESDETESKTDSEDDESFNDNDATEQVVLGKRMFKKTPKDNETERESVLPYSNSQLDHSNHKNSTNESIVKNTLQENEGLLTCLKEKRKKIKSEPSLKTTVSKKNHLIHEPNMVVTLKEQAIAGMQRSLIAEAFENDAGVVLSPNQDEVDFAAEKASMENSELPQPFIDSTLIGWGSWAGCGISDEKRKRNLRLCPNPDVDARLGVLPSNRKDSKLPHVIIREKKHSKQIELKYQIDRLPHPYDNEVHFNAANYLMPVGKEWNPESVVQKKITPRISQNLNGKIIKPIPYYKKA